MMQEKWVLFLKKDRFTIFTTILLAGLIGILFFYSLFRRFDMDEFEAIHTAWKMVQGEKIYVDFFQHHHPLLYYCLMPLVYIFGDTFSTLIASRMLCFIFFLLMGVATYHLCSLVYEKQSALLSIVLLYATPIFSIYAIEVRPDVLMTMFGLFSILFLFIFFEKRRYLMLALSSFCAAFAYLSLQKASTTIVSLGIILLLQLFFKKISFKDLFIWGGIFCVPIGLYCLFHLQQGSFQNYFSLCYLWNLQQGTFPNYQQIFTTFMYAYNSSQIFWLFYLLGILFFTKTNKQKILVFLSLSSLATVTLMPVPFQQYLLPALPLIAITVAHTFKSIFQHHTDVLFTLILVTTTIQASGHYIRRPMVCPNIKQWVQIDRVLALSTKNDYVMSSNKCDSADDNTYYMWNLYRKDYDFFWLYSVLRCASSYEKITHKAYPFCAYTSIDRYKPKFITKSALEVDGIYPLERCLQAPEILEHYTQSNIDEDLLIRKS